MKIQSKTIAASVACALLLVGCATQQQTQTTPVKPAAAPAPTPAKSTPPAPAATLIRAADEDLFR